MREGLRVADHHWLLVIRCAAAHGIRPRFSFIINGSGRCMLTHIKADDSARPVTTIPTHSKRPAPRQATAKHHSKQFLTGCYRCSKNHHLRGTGRQACQTDRSVDKMTFYPSGFKMPPQCSASDHRPVWPAVSVCGLANPVCRRQHGPERRGSFPPFEAIRPQQPASIQATWTLAALGSAVSQPVDLCAAGCRRHHDGSYARCGLPCVGTCIIEYPRAQAWRSPVGRPAR